jgi:hypothetical protein
VAASPVGGHADRSAAFGDRVGVRAGGVDDLVELLVQAAEPGTGDGPVGLLADQAQIDQVDQGLLQRRRGDVAGLRLQHGVDGGHGGVLLRGLRMMYV